MFSQFFTGGRQTIDTAGSTCHPSYVRPSVVVCCYELGRVRPGERVVHPPQGHEEGAVTSCLRRCATAETTLERAKYHGAHLPLRDDGVTSLVLHVMPARGVVKGVEAAVVIHHGSGTCWNTSAPGRDQSERVDWRPWSLFLRRVAHSPAALLPCIFVLVSQERVQALPGQSSLSGNVRNETHGEFVRALLEARGELPARA